MKLKKYKEYKSSGVEWLGDIPKDWENYRIDWIGAIVRGNTGFKKDELLNSGEYVALQYGKTYKVDEVNNTFKFFVNSDFYKKGQIVHSGDTILISTSETIEDLGHTCFYNRDDLGVIGGEQILFKPNRKLLNEKYLYYYSKYFRNELKRYATGLKVFRFNTNDLKKISIAIPQLKTQTAIANYLDQKTRAIDKKVNLLKQKMFKYKELRKSVINKSVTNGLNSNVKYHNSGIGWLNEKPESWIIMRLGDVFVERSEKVSDTEYKPLSVTYNGILPQLKNAAKTKNGDNRKKVLINDFVINSRSDRRGSSGVSEYNGSVSVISIILKPNKITFPKYYHYLFKCYSFTEEFYRIGKGIVDDLWSTKYSTMRTMQIPVPPISEQTQIAEYLDHKTSTIDKIVENIKQQIVNLKELRKTLINDVVTGKIMVND